MAEPENTRQSCRDGVCWSWMDGDWSWRERRRERAGCGVCGLVGVRDTTPEPHPAPTGTTRRGLTSYSAGLGEMQGGHRPRPKRKRFDKTPTACGAACGGVADLFLEHSTHIRLSAQAPAQRQLYLAHSDTRTPACGGSLPTPLGTEEGGEVWLWLCRVRWKTQITTSAHANACSLALSLTGFGRDEP